MDGANHYGYVSGNPINYTDPTGLFGEGTYSEGGRTYQQARDRRAIRDKMYNLGLLGKGDLFQQVTDGVKSLGGLTSSMLNGLSNSWNNFIGAFRRSSLGQALLGLGEGLGGEHYDSRNSLSYKISFGIGTGLRFGFSFVLSVFSMNSLLKGSSLTNFSASSGGLSGSLAFTYSQAGVCSVASSSMLAASVTSTFQTTNSIANMMKGDVSSSDGIDNVWHKGSFNSSEQSLQYHFKKHGAEVNAKDIPQYVNKAKEFAKKLKGAKKFYVDGDISSVMRYVKNGRYIDIASDGRIISFGAR